MTQGAAAEYSIAERDRRWDAVRKAGAEAGFDCIFVPLGAGMDAVYLTGLKGAVQSSSIVLPTDGRPPVILSERGDRHWVPEPKIVRRAWAEPTVEALYEAGMDRARIGVVGLKGGTVTNVRTIDGVVNHYVFQHVLQQLPNATFEDATDVLGFVRFVKSEEEIAMLRRSVQIAESALDRLAEIARPGVHGATMFAAVMERLLEQGSEYYPFAFRAQSLGEPAGPELTDTPLRLWLQEGMMVHAAASAVWAHQVCQEHQPILLGRLPARWQRAVDLHRELFQAGLDRMRPGTTFAELAQLARNFGGGELRTVAQLQGAGYGDDGPVVVEGVVRDDARELEMRAGNVFIWTPLVSSDDDQIRVAWGGTVLVTPAGGQPLFSRPHGILELG